MEKMSFVGAAKKFFGYKDGQTLKEFSEELKKLTEQDRKDLTPMLEEALGVEIS